MQRAHGLPVPVQIGEHQERILGTVQIIPHNNILLLGPALQNVEHPVQTALFALSLHERSHVLRVDLWRLGDHAELLVGVFLDVLRRAWPDQVELEVLLDV